MLDLACVLLLRELTHLPIIVDPSHAPGRRTVFPAMARAAIATGAQGLILEGSPEPNRALCDGRHLMTPQQGERIVSARRLMASALHEPGKEVS